MVFVVSLLFSSDVSFLLPVGVADGDALIGRSTHRRLILRRLLKASVFSLLPSHQFVCSYTLK